MNEALIVFLPVADLERSSRFYGEMLELPLVLDQGTCRIHRVAPGGFVGLCERAEVEPSEGTIVTIVRDDVDAYCARLEARGVTLDHPPRPNPTYRIYHTFLRDPDGHRVEIQRFDDPRWSSS